MYFVFFYHQKQESILKKRLQVFLTELLKFGTIKGFKNFAMYLRGREELVISVLNEPKVSLLTYTLSGLNLFIVVSYCTL